MTAFYPLPFGGDAQHRPGAHPSMTLEAFRPMVKGTRRGFATVRMPDSLVIADCAVCTSHGKVWATLPSKPIVDDGRHVEKDGKRQYIAILKWADRATADRWSAEVVALVRAAHPEALDDGSLL